MVLSFRYDIVGLSDRESEQCDGIEQSVEKIKALLYTENAAGLPYSRMMLAGFSQGGAMSIFTGLQLPAEDQKLAGILVMSGYLPGRSKFKLSPGLESLPVLHCHGSADPMVNYHSLPFVGSNWFDQGVTSAGIFFHLQNWMIMLS